MAIRPNLNNFICKPNDCHNSNECPPVFEVTYFYELNITEESKSHLEKIIP